MSRGNPRRRFSTSAAAKAEARENAAIFLRAVATMTYGGKPVVQPEKAKEYDDETDE